MSGLFGPRKAQTNANKALGIQFQGAQYGPVVPVVYGMNKIAGNCIWYGDFAAQAHQQKAGKGGGSSTTNYTYSASAQMGLCEGPNISLVQVLNGNGTVNLSSVNYSFSAGNAGQSAWSHLSGSSALGYSLTAIFSFQNLELGSTASLPNWNYVINGLKQYGSGITDANPADILTDICTDTNHGVYFPYLGTLTQYSNYCVANSLFLSPVYDQQQTATQTLSDLFKYTNAYAYYSEDQLKVVPLGDVAVTGNGVTYTPDVTPVVDLGTNDFIVSGNGPSITIDRKAPQDNLNLVRVEFTDGSNTFHTGAVVASIDEDMITNGARSDSSETVNGCMSASVARFIAQNLVQRAYYVRNQYTFKLTWRYCYLEPADIVTLTDSSLGLNLYPVRILSVDEDAESGLTITAEEFPEGIGHSAIYNTQPNSGTNVDPGSDPGAVNAPYLFRGPGFLVNNSTPEIWCAVNGSNPLWAACDVYLSHDGTSYTYTGTVASQARYGSLNTALPAGSADPDTTNTPKVQLYAPGQLLGGSSADADNFVTLSMVDTEIIAYETATLVSANEYTLGYLRRGGYGSTNASHSIGAPFVRLDDSIFRIPVDPSLIGQTVYLKFLSLNAFGQTPRTLADETVYSYVVGTNVELPDVPDVPNSFSTTGVADGVTINWTNDNPAAVGCTSLEYSTYPSGPFTVLAQVGPTTTTYHHSFTSGSTYYYRARARGPLVQSGWSAYTSVYSSAGVAVSTGLTANAQTLLNGRFLLGLNNWNAGLGWGSDSTPRAVYSGFAGASGTYTLSNSINVPCVPGSQIIAQALLSSNSANGDCYAGVEFLDSSLNHVAYAYGGTITGTTSPTLSHKVALAPSGSAFARFFVGAYSCTTGNYYVQDCLMSVTLSSVDDLPDGTSRFAVTNGTGLNGVSAVDPNKKALIDFTQTAHVGKVLDNIGDGTTRFAVTNGTGLKGVSLVDGSNRAGIDFSQSVHLNKILDNMGDGTYARILASQLQGGQHKLEIAGSGHQLGDQRANLPVNSAGPVSKWHGLTVSYTSTSTSATISVSSASLVGVLPNANFLTYNASSATVSGSPGTNTTYYLYYVDPTFAGGTQTLHADTNGNDVYGLGNVLIGSVTVSFPSSGSGGGGGSGGLCVADDMWVTDGLLAGDAKVGDQFDCIDLPSEAGKHKRALVGVERGIEDCVRLISSDGCALVCSLSTPFDLPDGRQLTATHMLGETVITDMGNAIVTSIALVGRLPVTRAHLGGVSYAAGADKARRIYSHNSGTLKP